MRGPRHRRPLRLRGDGPGKARQPGGAHLRQQLPRLASRRHCLFLRRHRRDPDQLETASWGTWACGMRRRCFPAQCAGLPRGGSPLRPGGSLRRPGLPGHAVPWRPRPWPPRCSGPSPWSPASTCSSWRTSPLAAVSRWDEYEGNLYQLIAALSGSDEKTVRFGVRTFGAKEGRLALNGRAFFLRGEANCAYNSFSWEGHPP